MQQTKLESLTEAIIGAIVGFGIQYAASYFFLNAIGVTISATQNVGFGMFMLVVSVIRQYTVRRFCQKYLTRLKDWIVMKLSKTKE